MGLGPLLSYLLTISFLKAVSPACRQAQCTSNLAELDMDATNISMGSSAAERKPMSHNQVSHTFAMSFDFRYIFTISIFDVANSSCPRDISGDSRIHHGSQGAVHKRRIAPVTPVMREEAPSLLIVLGPATDVITASHNPDHPAGLLRGQILSQALRVGLEVRGAVHGEAPLGEEHGEVVDGGGVGGVEGLEAVVVEAGLERGAVGDAVGVVVQLEDDLVGGEVGAREGPAARGQGGPAHDGRQEGVEVEPGQDDERVRVGGADCGGALLDVLVPVLPVVCLLEGGVVVGPAGLVAEGHGRQGGP